MNCFEIINTTDKKIEEISYIEKIITYALSYESIENAFFNIIIVDNKTIQDINKQYRNIDSATDVISFALEDDKTFNVELPYRVLGDIYISIDKAIEQSNTYKNSLKFELTFLGVHGLLHLLGYDHMNKEDEEVMFKKQEVILNEYEKVQ